MRFQLLQDCNRRATGTRKNGAMDTYKVMPSALLLLAAGCTTLDCGPDWYATGQRDGRLGAQPQSEFYAQRCSTPVDSGSYLRGWQDGLRARPIPTS
jgi:hypothetical protein